MEQTSIQIHDILVRKAVAEDAAEIANVHLNSWRGAYHKKSDEIGGKK